MSNVESIYNLIKDPNFESGIAHWTEVGDVQVFYWVPAQPGVEVTHSGYHAMFMGGMQPSGSGGPSGAEYLLGVLEARAYRVGMWLYRYPFGATPPFDINVRAGRSDTGTPGIVFNTSGAVDQVWTYHSGTFIADGIHPYKIQIINDGAGLPFYIADDVYVVPLVSDFQADTYAQMNPVADQDANFGFPLRTYLGAAAAMFDQIEFYARDRDGIPGWAHIANLNTVPVEALDYISQIAGVELSRGSLSEDKRVAIQKAEGRERGTRRAIAREVQKELTGTKSVFLFERILDDDHFSAGVYRSEVPATEYAWPDWIIAHPFPTSFIGSVEGDFESGTASTWSTATGGPIVSGATKSISNDFGYTGRKCLKVVTTDVSQGVRKTLGTIAAGNKTIVAALRGINGTEQINMQFEYNGVMTVTTAVLSTDEWTLVVIGPVAVDGVNANFLSFLNVNAIISGYPKTATFFLDTVGIWDSAPLPTPSFPITNNVYKAVNRQIPVGFKQDQGFPIFFDAGLHYDVLGATYSSSVINGGQEIFASDYLSLLSIFWTYSSLLNNVRIPEYLGNPGFEINDDGWAVTGIHLTAGATKTRITALQDTGVASEEINTTAGNARGIEFTLGVLPAGTYSLTFRARGVAGGDTALEAVLGSAASPVVTATTLTTSYQTFSPTVNFVADGVATVAAAFRRNGSLSNFRIDEIHVTKIA